MIIIISNFPFLDPILEINKRRIIALDFDGVFTLLKGRKDRLFKVLVIPYLIQALRFLLKPVPNQKIIDAFKEAKNNRKFCLIILTSRPYYLRKLVRKWLAENDISCPLFCVGRFINPTKKKEEFLERLKEKFEIIVVDNSLKTREVFRKKGFKTESPYEFCQNCEIQAV